METLALLAHPAIDVDLAKIQLQDHTLDQAHVPRKEESGQPVIAIIGQLDRFIETGIKMLLAQEESERLRRELKRNYKERRAQGKPMGGSAIPMEMDKGQAIPMEMNKGDAIPMKEWGRFESDWANAGLKNDFKLFLTI